MIACYDLHEVPNMRTTLNLDGEALEKVLRLSPGKTKTEVINEALREAARRKDIAEIRQFRGKFHWEGNLDELRGREPRSDS